MVLEATTPQGTAVDFAAEFCQVHCGAGQIHVGIDRSRGNPQVVAGLQVGRGDVEGAGVTEDHRGSLVRRHLAAQPADDDGQLSVGAQAIRLRRVADRVRRPADGGGRLPWPATLPAVPDKASRSIDALPGQ